LSIQLDLSSPGGCSDNPLTRLITVLKEGLPEVRVKSKTNIVPYGLAKLLGDKYGYSVEVLESSGEDVLYLFKKI